MTTSLFRVYRTAADVLQCRAAPGPSGGVYVAEGDNDGFTPEATLLRLSSSGSIVWSKLITCTDGGASVAFPWIASNSTHVAAAFEWGGGEGVILYDASGTEVWSTQVPMAHTASTGIDPWSAPPIALGSDNSVFMLGSNLSYAEALLCKLNASTGAITWSVNLRDNAAGGTDRPGSLAVLSGGDVIVHVRGPFNYVMRLSGADGSVVWCRGVTWPSGGAEIGVGVDPSDNIYLVGRPPTGGTEVLPVVKLDSGGAELWNRNIVHGSGLSSLALTYIWSGRLTADATGVYIPCYFGSTNDSSGHVFVPQDGTVAAGTALVATFDQLALLTTTRIGSAGGTGTPSVFAYQDAASPSATYSEAIVVTAGSAASEDGSWGGRVRTTYGFDVASGTAVVTTRSYTRASMPSFSASSFSYTTGASTLLVESFAVAYSATSLGPTATFGTPRLYGYVEAGPYTPSTSFGTPVLLTIVNPATIAPTTAFGTPALSLNKTVAASSIPSTLTFGLPWAERDPVPRPIVAAPTAVSTAFGRPTATSSITVGATSADTTTFGVPTAQVVVSATGSTFGAFGTPTIQIPVRATSILPTTMFGLATRAGFGGASSLGPGTSFGTPSVRASVRLSPSSIVSTTFGTPSCLNTVLRARSGVFRTRWGLPQAERTAP